MSCRKLLVLLSGEGRCGDDAFFFSSRRRHTRSKRDWSSDVCSSDLGAARLGCVERYVGLVTAIAQIESVEQIAVQASPENAIPRTDRGAVVHRIREAEAGREILVRARDAARLRVIGIDHGGLRQEGLFVTQA